MLQVKVLGMGDARHKELGRNMTEALLRCSLDAQLFHVMDVDEIVSHGVTSIPAILIGEEIFFQNNHLPDTEELTALLKKLLEESNQDAA